MKSIYRYMNNLGRTIAGHKVQVGNHTYLFHFGRAITALGGCEDTPEGWHCYHVINGYDRCPTCGSRMSYRDMAETIVNVNDPNKAMTLTE